MDAKLKKGAFGYNSKEVESYIVELSSKYLNDIKSKNAELDALKAKTAELESKIAEYEKERLSVADALVKAQNEAKGILDEAVSEANAEKEKIQAECREFEAKIEKAKKTLTSMRKEALKIIDDYKDAIDGFAKFADDGDD